MLGERPKRHLRWLGVLLLPILLSLPGGPTAPLRDHRGLLPSPGSIEPGAQVAGGPVIDRSVGPEYAPPPPNSTPASYSWLNVTSGPGPPGRFDAASAFDATDGYVLLFGGESPSGGALFGDTWSYEHGNWKELCSGTSGPPHCANEPPPSAHGSMAYDAALSGVVYWDWATSETWRFAFGSWTELTLGAHPPEQSTGSAIAYDPALGAVLLFTSTGATWSFTNSTWRLSNAAGAGPAPRVDAQMFFDTAEERLVLFGGVEGSQFLNDTWAYARGNWTEVTNRSAPFGGFAAVYDASYGYGALLTQGPSGRGLALWGYAQGNWSSIPRNGSTSPPVTLGASFVFDQADGYLLMFPGEYANGQGLTADPYTWALVDTFHSDLLFVSRSPVVLGDTYTIVPLALGGVLPYTYTYNILTPGCGISRSQPSLTCPTLTTGTFPLGAIVADGRWGNAVLTGSVTVMPVPSPEFDLTPDPTTVGIPVHFTAVVTGGIPPFAFRWSFGDDRLGEGTSPAHTYLEPGQYNVTLTIANATNVSEETSATVYVNPTPALEPIDLLTNITDTGIPLTFSTVLRGGTGPYTYSWHFGDGVGTGTGPTIEYAYSTPGTYRATVWGNDSVGAGGVANAIVQVNEDPNVEILYNKAAYNTTVSFGAGVAGGTAPFVFVWSFGDGSVTAGASATHVYAAKGHFLVSLSVRDGAGFSLLQTLNLTVNPGTPPSPPPPWYEVPANLAVLGLALGAAGATIGLAEWYGQRLARRPPVLDDELIADELTRPRWRPHREPEEGTPAQDS
jgi:PKD repeat protein